MPPGAEVGIGLEINRKAAKGFGRPGAMYGVKNSQFKYSIKGRRRNLEEDAFGNW